MAVPTAGAASGAVGLLRRCAPGFPPPSTKKALNNCNKRIAHRTPYRLRAPFDANVCPKPLPVPLSHTDLMPIFKGCKVK